MGGEFDFRLGGSTIVSENCVCIDCRRLLFCSDLSTYLLCVRLVLCSDGSRVRPSLSAVSCASASVFRWSRTCHEINSESCPFLLRPGVRARLRVPCVCVAAVVVYPTVVGIGILS